MAKPADGDGGEKTVTVLVSTTVTEQVVRTTTTTQQEVQTTTTTQQVTATVLPAGLFGF